MTSLGLFWSKKKFWLPRGYRLKLFLTFMGVLIICGGGLIIIFGQIQKHTLLNQTYKKGRFVSTMLARNLETPLFFMNLEQIKDNVEAILEVTDIVGVIVYDANGNKIFTRFTPHIDDSITHPEEMKRLAGFMTTHKTIKEETRSDHWRQDHYFVFCRRIIIAGQPKDDASLYFDTDKVEERTVNELGSVQIIFGYSLFDQGMARINRYAMLIFISFLPISLLMAFMLARDVVRPLGDLVASLKNRLEVTDEIEEKTSDELGQLDESFRHLVERLDGSFDTIARMNEALEEKVAARTAELTMAMQELKEAQNQLVQSEKMGAVGQLVAGVAHEVNNTTNFITGALPPLGKRLDELRLILTKHGEQDSPDSGRVMELMQSVDLLMGNIREGARRTSKIVSDLKNFSRPDDDLSRRIDINECLESTLSLVLSEYRHRIKVIKDFSPDLPMVPGSQGQLNQVFMNLIINAVHAQPDGGELLIRTFAAGDGAHVVFTDKGPGIPQEIQAKIFDPFFTTKEVGKGTGLGLSVSYGIISKHRGRILVHSEPGQGAEFEIILPAWQETIGFQHEEGDR
ncbi:MAG: ATP-binding protein [Desulfobulbaceae bacterium]|nr:ATP-binding protein [Desulfobulbaceae bacterium]HIJ91407.1 hypothetical protein [Deltaproteobacteria bacterium]